MGNKIFISSADDDYIRRGGAVHYDAMRLTNHNINIPLASNLHLPANELSELWEYVAHPVH